jgi:hypothetical protein
MGSQPLEPCNLVGARATILSALVADLGLAVAVRGMAAAGHQLQHETVPHLEQRHLEQHQEQLARRTWNNFVSQARSQRCTLDNSTDEAGSLLQ